MVRAPAIVMLPLGALKVPPEIVNAPLKSDPDGTVRVPDVNDVVLAAE